MKPALDRPRDLFAPAAFVGVVLALTWATTALLGPVRRADEPAVTMLLHASVLYVAVLGWQPLVAMVLMARTVDDHRALDRGLGAMRPRFVRIALALPLVLLGGAAAIDAVISPGPARNTPLVLGWAEAVCAALAFAAVLAVLWLQAMVEEAAWRGYLLPRLMRLFGPWPGLVLHGLLWGACYAPVLLVGDPDSSGLRIAGFVVTCGLLGVLLGWLRLASRSVIACAASNATLTVCAGLPLVLQGTPSRLGAVFEPVGWVPMLALITLIALRASLRAAVVVPERPIAEHVN